MGCRCRPDQHWWRAFGVLSGGLPLQAGPAPLARIRAAERRPEGAVHAGARAGAAGRAALGLLLLRRGARGGAAVLTQHSTALLSDAALPALSEPRAPQVGGASTLET